MFAALARTARIQCLSDRPTYPSFTTRTFMYAVIETGGKQYRVAPGDVIQVETLPGDVNSEVEFDRVLAVFRDSNELLTGAALGQARVKGTIVEQDRGDKVLVF